MPDKPTIELAKNGPLLVKGLDDLQNSKGEPIPTKKVMALCHCGASETKPFLTARIRTSAFQMRNARAGFPINGTILQGKGSRSTTTEPSVRTRVRAQTVCLTSGE